MLNYFLYSMHINLCRSFATLAGNATETGLALLLLFIFALIASGYVLKEGLRKKEKTTHELLLKCVIIITSVVPRQLPMQVMALFRIARGYERHIWCWPLQSSSQHI